MKNLICSGILCCAAALGLVACETKVKKTDACGDGVLDPGEACDGAALSVSRCLDLGYYEQDGDLVCNDDCTLDLSVCAFSCGDGQVQADYEEECDGANLPETTCAQIGMGGGTLTCTATCRYDVSACEGAAVCGDGQIMAPYEQCEGEDLAGQTCEGLGYWGGALACDPETCTFDTGPCEVFGRCGDGVLQGTYEECEGTEFAGATCVGLGFFDGTLRCGDDCLYDPTSCQAVTQLSADNLHACVRLSDGTVRCWGDNQAAQLGQPAPTDSTVPLEVPGLADVVAVDAGSFITCVVLGDGTGRCWGGGTGGQLGHGTAEMSVTPVPVSGLSTIVRISAGYWQACALLADGTASCWGANQYGQVGDGTIEMRLTPVAVSGLTGVVDIGTGAYHTCALLDSGVVKCWGYNEQGQLGDGIAEHADECNNKDCSMLPVTVAGITNAVALAVGGDHACALLDDGTLKCWGDNGQGQLGIDPMTLIESPSPVAPSSSSISNLRGVFAGSSETCVLWYNDSVRCWGENSDGQFGDGTTTDSHQPHQPTGLGNVEHVAVGSRHACALPKTHDTVWCWGDNADGQLGDGTVVDSLAPVELVP